MKAILTFNLPDDQDEFRSASRAGEAFAALWKFNEYLRDQEKYVEPEHRDDLAAVRRRWFSTAGDLLE